MEENMNKDNYNELITVGNRVKYIEPNYSQSILEQGPRGLHSYEFQSPLEDYCIFVNLKVEVRGRSIRTDYNTNGVTYSLNYSSQQGKEAVTFFQGTNYPNKSQNIFGKDNYSLTTDYLDHIYLNDLVKRDENGTVTATNATTEMFGINSIDIQYNSYMVPEVTIKFTDVRGASLFAAEEARHHLNMGSGIEGNVDTSVEGSFFKCFFTFPYPKFTLAVKGFYGQPVAYELTCSDFRASFNSDTGNFEATAKFIGYAFSFLGDVMMNALTAAPFSDFLGRSYWEENVSNGRFYVKDVNGNHVPMITLGEFVTKVDSAMKEAQAVVASSPVAQEALKRESESKQIDVVSAAYSNYTTKIYEAVQSACSRIKDDCGEFNFACQSGSNLLAFIPGVEGDETFTSSITSWYDFWSDDEVEDAYKSLLEAVGQNAAYKSKIEKINVSTIKPIRVYDDNGHYLGNKTLDAFPNISNAIKRNEEVSNGKKNENGANIIQRELLYYAFPFIDNDLSGQLKDDKTKADAAIQEIQEDIGKVSDKAIADCLGFNPSIESITRMIMAHFETLMYMVTTCARAITGQSRTMEYLGITTQNAPDISQDDKIIPPFPKITNRIVSEGVEKDEEAWIGNFGGDWLEKDLVNGLLNGINEMSTLIQQAQSGSTSDSGRLKSVMKIPLNPLDMILDKNPYGEVQFTDKSDFAGHVIMRMFEILSLNEAYADIEDANALGEAEAVNFKEFFKNPPDEFKQWLNNGNIVDTIIKIVKADLATPCDEYGKNAKYAWESGKIELFNHTPMIKDWKFNVFKGKHKTYLPIQDASFKKILRDVGAPDANGNCKIPRNMEDYINSNPSTKGLLYIDGKIERLSSNKLICIEPNPDRFSTIADNQCQNVGLDKLYNKFKEDTAYDPDKFCDYLKHDTFIKTYNQGSVATNSNENEDGSNESEPNDISKPVDIEDWAESINEASGLDSFRKDIAHNVDAYRVLYIPAVKPNISVLSSTYSDDGTLFVQRYYYERSMEERAYMYLLSLGYYIKYDDVLRDIFDQEKTFCTVPKAGMLLIGALCYFSRISSTQSDFNIGLLALASSQITFRKLRSDLINDFISYFTDWVKKDFVKIDSYLSLNISDYKGFFDKLSSCDDDEGEITKLVKTYLPSLSANYSAVNDSVGIITAYSSKFGKELNGRTLSLGMNPDGEGSYLTTKLVLGSVTFVKTADVFSNRSETYSIKDGKGESFLNGFINRLRTEYSTNGTDSGVTSVDIERAKDCKTDTDIKIGVYRYLKLLYDKWIAGSIFETDFKMEKFFEDSDCYFHFIDTYYNKVGNRVLVNVSEFKDDIVNSEVQDEYSLLSLLSKTYATNKCNFLCIQNFLELGDEDNIRNIFKPVSLMQMGIPTVHPNFIVQFAYETSSHLDIGSKDYSDDSFSIKDGPQDGRGTNVNKWPVPLNSSNECGYTIPAFGVSYGKQYQSYFTNVSISMDNPMVTEQSIKAQFQIASMNAVTSKTNEGTATRNMTTMGQDLFTIYSNSSYTCEVDMLGNAWIQPLMYFELLNIPMFKGTYLIEKVSHHIEAGKMTTHFVGVRMANTTTKLKDGWFYCSDPDKTGAESEEEQEHQLADVVNDCEYATYPLGEIKGVKGLLISQNGISTMDYFEADQRLKWYINGDVKGVNHHDGAGTTCGPGLTGNYLRHGRSASGLIQGFMDALRDHDAACRKYIKGKRFKQESIDAMFHILHWQGETKAKDIITKFNNDTDVYNWLKTKSTGRSGHQGMLLGYAWIIGDSEPKGVTWQEGQKARAKAGYDIYHSLNKPLLQAMNLGTPPTVNDNTNKKGKDKGIWDDFANAVYKTALETPSCGIELGIVKKNANHGWFKLKNSTGGRDKLGNVFDIILNGYSEYIQELWWVVRNGQDVGEPLRLSVVVSKKPTSNIKVGMIIDGENHPFNHLTERSNEKYRRAIVKFYSKNNRYNPKNENECVYGKVVKSRIPKGDWEKFKPQACSEVMSGNGGGKLDANKKIGRWDVGKSISYALSKASSRSNHNCAGAVNDAIAHGGIKAPRADTYHGGTQAYLIRTQKIPQSMGWSMIADGVITKEENTSLNIGRQMGDIGVVGSEKTARNSSPYCYHMAIWTGTEWVSDYKQGQKMVPGNYFNFFPQMPYSIYRYNG